MRHCALLTNDGLPRWLSQLGIDVTDRPIVVNNGAVEVAEYSRDGCRELLVTPTRRPEQKGAKTTLLSDLKTRDLGSPPGPHLVHDLFLLDRCAASPT